VPIGIDRLRLLAALTHGTKDADVELGGGDRRWLISYGRPDATIDPCGFRQLVLAAKEGRRTLLPRVEVVTFVGALREIGGGVAQRRGPDGHEHHIATLLPATGVTAILAELPEPAVDIRAAVRSDAELGASVVVLTSPVMDHRVDVLASQVAARCMVEELLDTLTAGPTR
jgi:hypothetical protein